MKKLNKRILKDESDQPIAVQIDYQDWLEIERRLAEASLSSGQMDLAGTLKWKGNALEFQRQMRSEWPEQHAGWPVVECPLHSGWALTEEHPACHNEFPILVSPAGDAYGPEDLLSPTEVAELRGIQRSTLYAYINRRSPAAGQGWMRIGKTSGWAIKARDAVAR